MWFYPYVAIQIASWSIISAWFSFTGNSYALALVNTGGDFDSDNSLFGDPGGSAAFFTRIGNDLTGTAALGAGRDHLEEASAFGYLPASLADGTLTRF